MSADVIIAVLQTALLGLFKDFTMSVTTFPLLVKKGNVTNESELHKEKDESIDMQKRR